MPSLLFRCGHPSARRWMGPQPTAGSRENNQTGADAAPVFRSNDGWMASQESGRKTEAVFDLGSVERERFTQQLRGNPLCRHLEHPVKLVS